MNPWLTHEGRQIYFDRIAPIDEHGNDTGCSSYRYYCANCGRDYDDYDDLADCVRDARRHTKE